MIYRPGCAADEECSLMGPPSLEASNPGSWRGAGWGLVGHPQGADHRSTPAPKNCGCLQPGTSRGSSVEKKRLTRLVSAPICSCAMPWTSSATSSFGESSSERGMVAKQRPPLPLPPLLIALRPDLGLGGSNGGRQCKCQLHAAAISWLADAHNFPRQSSGTGAESC